MRFAKSAAAAAAVAASVPLVFGQTSTSCNPTEKTCPKDPGLSSETFTTDFTKGSSALKSWSQADGTNLTFGSNGAEFSIATNAQAPTIQTDFYIFFGRVDVKMQAAPGTGIVSSVVFESDDLDEIDWEFLGGSPGQVQSDFFGKGNTTAYNRVGFHDVSAATSETHTYSVDWTSSSITWSIDGTTVRTLSYDDPLTVGGQNYPQTPMRVKLGNWCGGCSSAEGTVTWAGGKTTFDNAPYVMYVEEVTITNYNPACSYTYGDMTGSYESIKMDNSSSCDGSDSSNLSSASATHAPTSSLSVATGAPTGAAVTKTDSSALAHATGSHGTGSAVTATTQVPGADPTGSGASNDNGTVTSGSPTHTASAHATGAAVVNRVATAGSLLSLFAIAMMLL